MRVMDLICGRIAIPFIIRGAHGYVERTPPRDWSEEETALQHVIVARGD